MLDLETVFAVGFVPVAEIVVGIALESSLDPEVAVVLVAAEIALAVETVPVAEIVPVAETALEPVVEKGLTLGVVTALAAAALAAAALAEAALAEAALAAAALAAAALAEPLVQTETAE